MSTDDYMAVEVTEGGHVKLTVDMGAHLGAGSSTTSTGSGHTSPMTIESHNPITYGKKCQIYILGTV